MKDKINCKKCGKDVKPVSKVFGVLLCPLCNIILDGGKFSIDKAGI